MHYLTGCNVPGFLPDGEVFAHESWADARDSLVDSLEFSRDWSTDPDDHDRLEEYTGAAATLNALPDNFGSGCTVIAGSLVWWIEACTVPDCECMDTYPVP